MSMTRRRNVGTKERLVSGLGGGALALWGLRRTGRGGLAVAAAGVALAWRGLTGWCNLYGTLGVDRAGAGPTVGNLGVKIAGGVVVAAPPERLYRFWRNFANLPRVMSHLERVEVLSDTRWHVKAPAGTTLTWEAEIINDQPPRLIAWRTLPGGSVSHAGSVRFVPTGAATRVAISLQYDPPGGTLGHAIAALMDADAGTRIEQDLQRFKRALQSGQLAA